VQPDREKAPTRRGESGGTWSVAVGTSHGRVLPLLTTTFLITAGSLGAARSVMGQASCASWPGEPDPLPTVGSSNSFSSLWAETRAAQLIELARRVEVADPAAARSLLDHALCLDAQSPDASAMLGTLLPLQTVNPRPSLRSFSQSTLDEIDRDLAEARAALEDARFRAALDLARALMERLDGDVDIPAVRARLARTAILAATVHTALGELDLAESALRQVRDLMPDYALADSAPPKLRRIWEQLSNAQVGAGR